MMSYMGQGAPLMILVLVMAPTGGEWKRERAAPEADSGRKREKEGRGCGATWRERQRPRTPQSTKRSGEETANRAWRPHLLASEAQRQKYTCALLICEALHSVDISEVD